MDSANINININQTIFQQLNTLQAEFIEIKNSVQVLEKNTVGSFNSIKNSIGRLSLNAVIEQINHVAESISELNKPAIDFNAQIADLSAITGIAGKDLEELSKVSKEVGRSSGLGASQAAEAFKLLASQISVDKIGIDGLKELQKQTIVLAQATGMDLPTAANAMASAINQFGLEAADASRVINVLAAGSKYGAAEVPQLADAFQKAGAVAAAAKLPLEALAGATEVLSQNATVGSEAGTAMRNIILKMQTSLGFDFSKITLSQALEELKPKLNDVTFLSKAFVVENMAAVQYLIQNAQAVDEMTKKVTGTNVALEQAEIRNKTYAHQMAVVKAWVDDVKISIVEMTGPVLPAIEVFAGLGKTLSGLLPLFNLLIKMKILFNKQTYITIGNLIKESALWVKDIALKGLQATWTGIVTAAQWALNVAMNANPIGIIITAVGALIGLFVILKDKWRDLINWFKDTWVGKFIMKAIEPLIYLVKVLWPKFEAGLKKIGDFFETLWQKLKKLVEYVTGMPITALEKYKENTEKLKTLQEIKSKQLLILNKREDVNNLNHKSSSITNPITGKISEVNGGSASGTVRNNNIRIENLVRQLIVNVQNANDIPANIKSMVEEALIAAIRDTEIAIS
ncbi:MAG: phage tail tape measure protein [Bacteroidales bacterium]|nr:phage tail tape measure protein [Bacteroidales bacterium]